MNAILEQINSIGKAFVEFSVPMLVQSSALILILLLADLILRRKVRAVFRYWIWMLVLIKLVLPTSLSSPVSLGHWFGDELQSVKINRTTIAASPQDPPQPTEPALTDLDYIRPIVVSPPAEIIRPPLPRETAAQPTLPATPVTPVTWQAVALLVWLAVVTAMGSLLLQRAIFVRGLVAQAKNTNGPMNSTLKYCCERMGMKERIRSKVSANAASPAVCGLFRPVILVPKNLARSLVARDLRAVLLHELAHIKRGDLWVNFAQTVLQIIYFYNPLLWLANAIIRRVREQAVDEAVLVAMGENAQRYPEMLVRVAKLAFSRPALSLRLIGVVESKNALAGRIKRILNRPIPKTAKVGILGLIMVIIAGCVLLPMAKAEKKPSDNTASALDWDKDGLENKLEQELGTNPKLSDTDRDGLSDYDEYCKYRTDPTKKDSDGDGKTDGDWEERREYTYTIRALCEIRPPSSLEVINDLYQDARVVNKKATLEDAIVAEVLIFPFATAHVYPQAYQKRPLPDSLKKYVEPTVAMNFSAQMKEEIGTIVKDAATDVEAIDKMLQWIRRETELVRYNPHWDFFRVINDKVVWHSSLGDSEQDKRLLETNFFGESMFKKKMHGTCSSTAILRGTMFRAAGLPTRLIQTLPLMTRYSEDAGPLADRLRMRAMAKGYDWGPGSGGANHMYNEVFLNNRWIRVDNSIGTGPFVSDKLFVKAWSAASLNNIKEEWNKKRCFRALDVSDANPKHTSSGSATIDLAVQDSDLTVKRLPDGRFFVCVEIHNNGYMSSPRFRVYHYSGDPDKGGKKLGRGYHNAGPIRPRQTWKEGGYFNLKPDDRQIFVVIDPDNTVAESDETNNKCSVEVGSAPKKVGAFDIAVEDFNITFRDEYNAYYVVASIRNKGRGVSPGFPVYFYIGDPAVAKPITHAAGPIKPGGVWSERSGNFGLREGVNMISVVIDPHNAFVELDETNNRASLRVVIKEGRMVEVSDETNKKASKTISTTVEKGSPRPSYRPASPSSKPNIYIMSPSGLAMFREIVNMVKDVTWNRTGRYHEKKSYDDILIDGIWNRKPGDILVLLFSLDTPERIPSEYEDLLPRPWPEIEERLKQGNTVELKGKARDLNIILLAAPTTTQLKQLIGESRLLNELSKHQDKGGVGIETTPALPDSDKDGLDDGLEAKLGTNPKSSDTDGDGLSDFQEIHKYLTDPAKRDTDGDGTADSDWNERREYSYSVRTLLRFMPPFDKAARNDDFQDARLLHEKDNYIELEVIHYPLSTAGKSITGNRNWQQDCANMTEYLQPGITTNWDTKMKQDLMRQLRADGIIIEKMTDKQVVEQVSSWLMKKSRYLDKVFTTFYVHYPDGQPKIYPGSEDAFEKEFSRDKENYDWTIDQHFDHELLGRGMFYNKTHGSCTSTAVYLATVLRALGIPTRMIIAVPAVDASDRDQLLLVKERITHNRVRETMLAEVRKSRDDFTAHTFNEVYVGNRWCRLDHKKLGQDGQRPFGLPTHLYTFNDLSEANLAPTWGLRYAKGQRSDVFKHSNPYSAIEVSDLFGCHSNIPNPPFTAKDLSSGPLPNIFIMEPRRKQKSDFSIWEEILLIVKDVTWNKTGRHHEKKSYDDILIDGIRNKKPGDILVLLFSLDTPQRIPSEYEDLLPKPWPQVEAALKRGKSVELKGKARDLNVILLATATRAQLKPLIRESKLLDSLKKPLVPETQPLSQEEVKTGKSEFIATLSGGVTVELVGVSNYPDNDTFWQPDGSKSGEMLFVKVEENKRQDNFGFVTKINGPEDMSISYGPIGGAKGHSAHNRVIDATGKAVEHYQALKASITDGKNSTSITFGIATSPWQTLATHTGRGGTTTGSKMIIFSQAFETKDSVGITVSTKQDKARAERIVAIGKDGQIHTGGDWSDFASNDLQQLTVEFHDLRLSDISEFAFQTRPYEWVEFRNVSLKPGHKADVQIETGKR